MGKPEAPPTYTNRSSDMVSHEQLPQLVKNEPTYFENASSIGWSVTINNRFWSDGFRIFVSKDSAEKFKAFKNNPNEHITDTFLIFRKYAPKEHGSFNIDKDYFTYCEVRKKYHMGYNTLVFDFTPDPNSPKTNFQIVMFDHSILPICDYVYKGQVHRWVDESYTRKFKSCCQVKFGFKHSILRPGQPSLIDNWDGHSYKLEKTKPNPYIGSSFKMWFRPKARVPKPEYYGKKCLATLGEEEWGFKLGYGEVKIDDSYNTDPNIDYESVLSMHEDALVLVCVATVLKKQKKIEEDARNSTA
ncbi:hypothetical protein CANMA_000384 [Candida margitis]|uniref:uncharacterized protein n=1 Tax=Candida margitis TaxID=1775924 RepID=UPI0022262461|nr:uncharacterized protein CANMA_000384 [Candida margitis]KAI5970565.1 hypothetical protein CANMA_000384 [Candida margitis]